MSEWAADTEVKVGPSTLAALANMAANPPAVVGLATGDFWTIVGKYMSRIIPRSETDRPLDRDKVRRLYVPHLGHVDNIVLLLQDIEASGDDAALAISTVQDCWSDLSAGASDPVLEPRTTRLLTPERPGSVSSAMAQIWRQAYLREHPSDTAKLAIFSKKMFPNIEFSAGAWSHLGTLSGAPADNLDKLMHHLSVLNDSVPSIWTETVASADREAALGSLGVTASLESPSTHKNKKAMKKRKFDFSIGLLTCEWHTKMRPDVNRIYYYADKEKVYVGKIVDHLPT